MRLLSWDWFWYVLLGFILGGGTVYLLTVLKAKAVELRWYEWLLFITGGVLFLLMGQTFIGSFAEGEPRAAWLSLVFLGIPVIVLGVSVRRLVIRRLSRT